MAGDVVGAGPGSRLVMKKHNLWNTMLIVLTIFGVGAGLIIWPLRHYLVLAAEEIRGGKHLMVAVVAGGAYVIGWFVTRVVEDSFDAIFSKAPFSEIRLKDKETFKHPDWVDKLLTPIGYLLFFGRVLLIIGGLVLLLRLLGMWLLSMHGTPNPGP